MSLVLLESPPIAIAGGAIYPYSDDLYASLWRESKYDDQPPYNMGRILGSGLQRRILVPRNMAPDCDNDLRVGGEAYHFTSAFKPRNSEQTRVVEETVHLLEHGYNFMVEAPTGWGKTAVAMEIIARIGRKTLVIITKDDIKSQWAKEAKKMLGLTWGHGLGLIQGDKIAVAGCGVVIAFVQSIAKEQRYPDYVFKDFGLVLVDECHRIGADFFSQAMYRSPSFMRFGLSATPDRADGREEVLAAHLGPVMVSTTLASMVPKVIVQKSPWRVPLTVKKNKKTGKSELGPIPHSPGKMGHVLKMIAKCHPRNVILCNYIHAAFKAGRHVLVQSDLKEHLAILEGMLHSYPGISPQRIGYYVGGMKEAAREEAAKRPILLATYQMTKEATNIPILDTLVMATPKSDIRQIAGRVLRMPSDEMISAGIEKHDPRLFDLVDDDSNVLKGYANNRMSLYRERGYEIINVG